MSVRIRTSIDPFLHQRITIERDADGHITKAFDAESGKEVPTRQGRAIQVRGMWFSLGRSTHEIVFPRAYRADQDTPDAPDAP